MPELVVKRVEELAIINTELDKDLTFEDPDANDTAEGTATSGVGL